MVFLNSKLTATFDFTKDVLHWQLPDLSSELGLPLSIFSDMDKILLAYDSNKILILDSINRKLHPWSLKNMQKIPVNFLKRYNRIVGITQLGLNKFVLWTNYTYSVLDLEVELPEEVLIV